MKKFWGIIGLVTLFLVRGGAGELEFDFTCSYDHSVQKAAAYVPDRIPEKSKLPLLVVAHYMGGNRFTARSQGYYQECEKRQWLVVCPELHGANTPGITSCAALPAQHDILDSIEYMKQKYPVDEHRIYIAGRSMGGMMTAVMMAKYPDLFAAGVAGQGVYDLSTMTSTPEIMKAIQAECGTPETRPFDCLRRSAVNYAPNFKYAPLIMWHGTNDTWVPTSQSETLYNAIVKYHRFQLPVYYLTGACHCEGNYTAAWECDQLQYYHNQGEAGIGVSTRFFSELELVTDEAKSFFWLALQPDRPNEFSRLKAVIGPDGLIKLNCENLARVTVNLDRLAKSVKITGYELRTDSKTVLDFSKDGKPVDGITGKTTAGTR